MKKRDRKKVIIEVLRDLQRSGESITCIRLQAICDDCSSKSIRRAIDSLREDRWPIESSNSGYFLREPSPTEITVTGDTHFGVLMIAGCSIDKNIGSFMPSVGSKIKKELFSLDDVEETESKNVVERSVDTSQSIYSKEQIATFGEISRNIINEIAVSFDYKNVGEEEIEVRAVYPIQLKLKNGVWYLLSWDVEKDGIRVFKLPKIKNIRSCEQRWVRPDNACIDEVLQAAQFSIWHRSGETTKMRIKVERHAKEHVEHYEITPNQRLVSEGDSSIVEFETSDIIGVLSWCRHYIHDIEILSPKSLKQRFLDDLRIGFEKHC